MSTREGRLRGRVRRGDRGILDEGAVITRVRAGEPEAYTEPVRAHTQVALRAAVAFGTGEGAEDLVQTSFLTAYQSLDRFREGGAFRPWLLQIGVNETRNTVRSAVRLRALAGREAVLLGAGPAALLCHGEGSSRSSDEGAGGTGLLSAGGRLRRHGGGSAARQMAGAFKRGRPGHPIPLAGSAGPIH
ncbi:RNA polymerase sigma factor [Streptomyces sp. NPDC059076]|uniref:RNA polymerase sigma factor n=1 Tax=unclassified Streptomyces TaxID=2593676 RepID=UPI0036AB9E36